LNQNILFQEEDEEENEQLKQSINVIKKILCPRGNRKNNQKVFFVARIFRKAYCWLSKHEL
jgi:hypothetical protein